MITGVVNGSLEVTIPIMVQDTSGRFHQLEALVDTGYNGFFTLTTLLVTAFGMPLLTSTVAQLADGSVGLLPVYGATVDWDGRLRSIEIDLTDTKPLVGTGLLAGYELRVKMVAGGSVTVDAIP